MKCKYYNENNELCEMQKKREIMFSIAVFSHVPIYCVGAAKVIEFIAK